MKTIPSLPPAYRSALALIASLFLLLLLAFLPLPIPPYLDFQVLYHADMGLVRGIPVYDRAGQVEMIAQLANVQPEQVNVLSFPYPPWVALAALPLALVPIAIAARLWFGLNLLMLFASIWLLTEEWGGRKRLLAFLPALLFPPVLGTLFVGQYILPVLLGAALWIHAVRREKIIPLALACALLTFKPHIGGPILLAGLVYLWSRREVFGRRALIALGLTGLILFAIGFLADPAWPPHYFDSLLSYRQNSAVASCGLCASLPVLLAGLLTGKADPTTGLFIAALILFLLTSWWSVTRPVILRSPAAFAALSILIVLLASPYALNYDYALLLLPLFVLAGVTHSRLGWTGLTFAYLLPFIALGLFGRSGNLALSISTLVLLLLLYWETRRLDAFPRAA